jgi:hypothetical protein
VIAIWDGGATNTMNLSGFSEHSTFVWLPELIIGRRCNRHISFGWFQPNEMCFDRYIRSHSS